MRIEMIFNLTEGSYIYCPALRYLSMDNSLNVYETKGIYVISTGMNSSLWEHLTGDTLTLIGKTNKTMAELEQSGIPVKTSLDNVRDKSQLEFTQSTDVLFVDNSVEEKDTSTFGKHREHDSAFE